jgi:hypothetical protein
LICSEKLRRDDDVDDAVEGPTDPIDPELCPRVAL